MSRNTFITAAVLAVIGSGAMAQGITGGTIGVEVTQPTDFNDFVGTNYYGAIEYGISRQFAVSLDVSSYRFDSLDQDATSATLHGIYHLSDSASVGLFYGQDKIDGEDAADLYGIEGGTEFMGGRVEGYVGRSDDGDVEAILFGADGSYSFNESISFKGGAAFLSVEDLDVSSITAGAEYTIAGGPSLYAELGNVNLDDGISSESETFIGIGARINFGAARGTTFGQRSAFEALPNF